MQVDRQEIDVNFQSFTYVELQAITKTNIQAGGKKVEKFIADFSSLPSHEKHP